jgi:hypothetical protein
LNWFFVSVTQTPLPLIHPAGSIFGGAERGEAKTRAAMELISVILLLVGAVFFCRLLLAEKNHAYAITMVLFGIFLIWWGTGDPNLTDSISFKEISQHKRSRAVIAGLACVFGSVCYWLVYWKSSRAKPTS